MAEEPSENDAQEGGATAAADAKLALGRKAEGGLTFRFAFDLPKVPSVMAVQTWSHQQMINGALAAVVLLMAAFLIYDKKFAKDAPAAPPAAAAAVVEESKTGLIRPNVETEFNPSIDEPVIGKGSYVDKLASVIGNVSIGKKVFIAPFASIRGDEGQPIVIGDGSNVQDGVVLHALETFDGEKTIDKNLVTVDGKRYAVYIGKGVSMAHQSQVHGPAAVGDHTFVGMQVLVFKAVIGKNVVLEPGAKIIGVTIADGRYVPAGSVITTQKAADALPEITADYPFATLNDGVLHVNEAFADKYLELALAGEAASGDSAAHGETTATDAHATTPAKKTATKEAIKPEATTAAKAETTPKAAAGH